MKLQENKMVGRASEKDESRKDEKLEERVVSFSVLLGGGWGVKTEEENIKTGDSGIFFPQLEDLLSKSCTPSLLAILTHHRHTTAP
jgi:hypothetical protein